MMQRPTNLDTTILVTHMTCLDGSGCAVMFIRAGGNSENIRYVPAGGLERWMKQERNGILASDRPIIVADIGTAHPDYIGELDRRGNLVVLDHHKTSIPMVGHDWAIVDVGACGTELLRRYLRLDELNDICLAEVIDDFDRWQRQIAWSSDLADFHVFLGQHQFVLRFAERRFEDVILYEEEDGIIRMIQVRKDEDIAYALRSAIEAPFPLEGAPDASAVILVTDCPYTTHLLDEALQRHPGAQLAVQVMLGIRKVSLRSRSDFDVSEVAKRFGGGGHAQAAGYRIQKSLIDDLVTEVIGG